MYSKYFKRFFDLFFALLLMPFFLILLVIVAPLIYLEDKGPVFYLQTRRGLRGKPFDIFKFRSMKVNAPDLRMADGSTWNAVSDPRVTRIGHILRQTSLDEIPQLINILNGDMSFIGPRPTLATQDYEQYSAIKKKRLEVRPGLTGYSQAYFRNSISAEEKFRQDCHYVENLSLMMDLKILVQTVLSVVARKDINQNEPPASAYFGTNPESPAKDPESHPRSDRSHE